MNPFAPRSRFREAVVTLVIAARVERAIRTRPLPQVAAAFRVPLEFEAPVAQPAAGEPVVLPQWVRETMQTTDAVMAHWPWGDTCLRKALVLGFRLRGLDPKLKIGVARSGGDVKAHAWIQIAGQSLDVGALSEYQSLQGAIP